MYNIMNFGEKHIACVLLVDTSGSMSGAAIQELNEGLRLFGEALQSDAKAYGCADVCVVSFGDGGVKTEVPFCPASEYVPPVLRAGGLTPMNEAVITALDMIELRKQEYKDIGVDYWRPWIFLMTDGRPTDSEYYQDTQERLQNAFRDKKINFFPMGIGGADVQTLRKYTSGGQGMVLKASKDNFQEAFVWLSSSMSVISNSDAERKNAPLPPLPSTITVEL